MEKKLFRLSIIFACSIRTIFSGRCGHALLNNVVAKLDAFNCSLWIPLDQSFSDFPHHLQEGIHATASQLPHVRQDSLFEVIVEVN